MKKKRLFLASTLLCIFINCFTKEGERITAKVAFVDGTVLLNGIEAQLNDFIKFGDVIETKARSCCIIIIDQKNIIELKEDSILVYKIKKDDAIVELKYGFLAVIIKNKKNIQTFRIITPNVTAQLQGTALFIGTESPSSTYACLCNGIIHFHPHGKAKPERHSASHHKSIIFRENYGIVVEEPTTIKYHSDESMENLAKMINEIIDWTKISE